MKKNVVYVMFLVFIVGTFVSEHLGAIDIYTFKKERVDQELEGNRGYIMGAPNRTEDRRPRKRTIIGVDIELPVMGSEEVTACEEAPAVKEEKSDAPPVAQTVVSSPDGRKIEVIDVSRDGKETSGEIDVLDGSEDDWIK
ncbi:MAG: hypothetical protein WCV56_05955 [Candidatus Omnitrophota bacterium]